MTRCEQAPPATMSGFILAAGFGTRLRPLTNHVPKALVTVGGYPLLRRALDFLGSQGIGRIGVNSHCMAAEIERFGESADIPFELFHEQGRIRGTGGALYHARSFLRESEAFALVNVDCVSRFDLAWMARRLAGADAVCGLVAVPVDGGGTVLYEPGSGRYRGTTSGAGERSRSEVRAAEYVGAAVYRADFLDLVREDDFSVVPVWDRAVDAGLKVVVLEAPSLYWIDVGTPRALARAHFDLIDGALSLSIPPWMVVDRERRAAYHRELPSCGRARLGTHCWVESPRLSEGPPLSEVVVMRDAEVKEGANGCIYTPWEVLSCDA